MCRLFPCIPIFKGFFWLKSVKKCVYVIMLKIALLLVKNLCFGVKKGISELLHQVAARHTANACLVLHLDTHILAFSLQLQSCAEQTKLFVIILWFSMLNLLSQCYSTWEQCLCHFSVLRLFNRSFQHTTK